MACPFSQLTHTLNSLFIIFLSFTVTSAQCILLGLCVYFFSISIWSLYHSCCPNPIQVFFFFHISVFLAISIFLGYHRYPSLPTPIYYGGKLEVTTCLWFFLAVFILFLFQWLLLWLQLIIYGWNCWVSEVQMNKILALSFVILSSQILSCLYSFGFHSQYIPLK